MLSLQRKIITSDLLGLATAEQRRMDNLNARYDQEKETGEDGMYIVIVLIIQIE